MNAHTQKLMVSGCLAACLWTLHGANLVTNGDFSTAVPSNGTGGGWTSSHVDSAGGWRSSGGNPAGMFGLNDAGQSGSDPTIFQIVPGLTAGVSYTLSGEYTSWILKSGSPGFAVDVDGATIGKLPTTTGWQPFTYALTASTTQMTIQFRAEIDGTDSDFAIDNISLVAVPEPAQIVAATAFGLVCFSASRRLRR